MRISHRSAIVNASRVREVRRDGDRRFALVMQDGATIVVSRSYRKRIDQILGPVADE